MTEDFSTGNIESLLAIMALLRSKDGCPWDREQTWESLVPYTLEEAYEVADAVASGSGYKICEELGDLLLQIIFYCQIASELGEFTFADVVNAVSRKLVRRHPHVFANERAETAEDVNRLWQQVKANEGVGESKAPPLPALLFLQKILGQISADSVDEPIIKELYIMTERADQENRCLEAEVKRFCANFWFKMQEFRR